MHPRGHSIGKKPSVKADLAIYCLVLGGVSGQCTSVSIMYRQKIDFSSCAWMVGFPKFGHICNSMGSSEIWDKYHECCIGNGHLLI